MTICEKTTTFSAACNFLFTLLILVLQSPFNEHRQSMYIDNMHEQNTKKIIEETNMRYQ